MRLLLDANLSPQTATMLRERFGYDVVDLMSLGLERLADDDVIDLAIRDSRIVVTEDLEFGQLYFGAVSV